MTNPFHLCLSCFTLIIVAFIGLVPLLTHYFPQRFESIYKMIARHRYSLSLVLFTFYAVPQAHASIYDGTDWRSPKVTMNETYSCWSPYYGDLGSYSEQNSCFQALISYASSVQCTSALYEKFQYQYYCQHDPFQNGNLKEAHIGNSQPLGAVSTEQCPNDNDPLYTHGYDDGTGLKCYNPDTLDDLSGCRLGQGNDYALDPVTSSSVCISRPDGASCYYDAINTTSGQQVYSLNPEKSCFNNDGTVPELTQNNQATDDTQTSCYQSGTYTLCPENPRNVCEGVNCQSGCGYINDTFVCISGDTDGDGVPDHQDPDIDGDGIPNASDPDKNGDGVDDPYYQPPSPSIDFDTSGIESLLGTGNSLLSGINSKLSQIASNTAKGSGSASGCESAPTCSGDPVNCAVLNQLWINNCSIDNTGQLAQIDADQLGIEGGNGQGQANIGADGRLTDVVGDDIDLSDPVSQIINASSGRTSTCPAARSISLSVGTFDVSYDPICEAATTINPIVLLIAGFIGVLIFVRGVTGG